MRLTVPCPKGPTDLQAHRFHMTLARLLLSHTDALVGYKYRNGVDNNNPDEDVWIAHRWVAESSAFTQHRVLPKRLAEPINRLMAVVASLHRGDAAGDTEA